MPAIVAELVARSETLKGIPGLRAMMNRTQLETKETLLELTREPVSATIKRRPKTSRSHPRPMDTREIVSAAIFPID
jgi:hypothetical protein